MGSERLVTGGLLAPLQGAFDGGDGDPGLRRFAPCPGLFPGRPVGPFEGQKTEGGMPRISRFLHLECRHRIPAMGLQNSRAGPIDLARRPI
jgi:hypothetical protein